MNAQPVNIYLNILRIIYAQNDSSGIGSNDICRQTGYGKNKQPIYKLIKDLKRGKLIKVISTKNKGKKEPILLSQLGREIVNFIDDVQKYSNSCLAFRNRFINLFDYVDGTSNDLRTVTPIPQLNITTAESLKLFEDFIKFYRFTENMSRPHTVIDRIILRYCLFASNQDLISNSFARNLLTQLLTKVINQELVFLTENNTELYHNQTPYPSDAANPPIKKDTSIEEIVDNASKLAWEYISNTCLDTYNLEIPYLRREFKDMAKMTLRMLIPSTVLPGLVEEYETKSKEAQKSKNQEYGERYGQRFQVMADLYKEIIRVHEDIKFKK